MDEKYRFGQRVCQVPSIQRILWACCVNPTFLFIAHLFKWHISSGFFFKYSINKTLYWYLKNSMLQQLCMWAYERA